MQNQNLSRLAAQSSDPSHPLKGSLGYNGIIEESTSILFQFMCVNLTFAEPTAKAAVKWRCLSQVWKDGAPIGLGVIWKGNESKRGFAH